MIFCCSQGRSTKKPPTIFVGQWVAVGYLGRVTTNWAIATTRVAIAIVSPMIAMILCHLSGLSAKLDISDTPIRRRTTRLPYRYSFLDYHRQSNMAYIYNSTGILQLSSKTEPNQCKRCIDIQANM
jgi:hypothetical protein